MGRLAVVALLALSFAFAIGCGRPKEPGVSKENAGKNRMVGEDKANKDKSKEKKSGGPKTTGPID
jgi:hypothetical protein